MEMLVVCWVARIKETRAIRLVKSVENEETQEVRCELSKSVFVVIRFQPESGTLSVAVTLTGADDVRSRAPQSRHSELPVFALTNNPTVDVSSWRFYSILGLRRQGGGLVDPGRSLYTGQRAELRAQ